MKELRKRGTVAAALVLPLIWGCGDGDSTDPVVVDFDPEPTTAFITETLGPLYSNENLLLGLQTLPFAVASADESTTEPTSALRRIQAPGTMQAIRQLDRPRWNPQQITFPAAMTGETLVYVAEEDRYSVDQEAEGAPAGGVRVTHYAMEPPSMVGAAIPSLPLQVRGYFDLTDESVGEEDRLGIEAVSTAGGGESTVADYHVGILGGGTDTEGDMEFSAVGSITGGGETLDFDLLQAFQWDQAADLDAIQMVYSLQTEGRGAVELQLTSEVPFNSFYDPLEIMVTVEEDARTTVLDFTLHGSTVTGEIQVDGVTAVLVSGQDPNPVFQWADDREMTTGERSALLALWQEAVQILIQPGQLFGPLDLIYYLD